MAALLPGHRWLVLCPRLRGRSLGLRSLDCSLGFHLLWGHILCRNHNMCISTETRWGRQFSPWEGDTGHVPHEAGAWGEIRAPGKPRGQRDTKRCHAPGDTHWSNTRQEPAPKGENHRATEQGGVEGQGDLPVKDRSPYPSYSAPHKAAGFTRTALPSPAPSGALTMHTTVAPMPGLEQNRNTHLQSLRGAKTCLSGTRLLGFCSTVQGHQKGTRFTWTVSFRQATL